MRITYEVCAVHHAKLDAGYAGVAIVDARQQRDREWPSGLKRPHPVRLPAAHDRHWQNLLRLQGGRTPRAPAWELLSAPWGTNTLTKWFAALVSRSRAPIPQKPIRSQGMGPEASITLGALGRPNLVNPPAPILL
jgi:hypothetical protein